MSLTKFLALCLPCLVQAKREENLADLAISPPSQNQFPYRISENGRPNQEVVGECSVESSAGFKMDRILVITGIRATDVVIRLRRIPVGFYVAATDGNMIRRTSIRSALVGKDVVEWDDMIEIPWDRSAQISITVFASFELGPTLGSGEILSQVQISAEELLGRGEPHESVKIPQKNEGGNTSHPSLELKTHIRVGNWTKHPSDLSESEEALQLAEFTDQGHHSLNRYRELEEKQELEESIIHFEHAWNLCPPDHFARPIVLFNLANAKLIHFRADDASHDLTLPINLYRSALSLRPRGHPDHAFTLLSLGVALKARFQTQGLECDEEEGRALLSQVLDISQAGSYVYLGAVLALGSAAKSGLIMQKENSQNTEGEGKVDRTLQRLNAALQLIFSWDSARHSLLDHLGVLCCVRLQYLGDPSDPHIDIAILTLERVVQWTSDDHPEKPSWLDNLGYLLLTRYGRSHSADDLEKSISTREEAVRLTPDGHPHKPSWLNNLVRSVSTRYETFGNVADLEKVISMAEFIVRLTPNDHPNKPLRLNNLGGWFSTRYERLGDVVDLEKSILVFEDAVRLTSDSSPEKLTRLNNLAGSLWTRYEHSGDDIDLEKSISMFTDVVRLAPDSLPLKPSWLNNLAISLSTRFERFGNADDLEKAIFIFEDVVRLTSDSHPNKSSRLNDLGNLFSTRYDRFGEATDLTKQISMHEQAVRLMPDGHRDKPSCLNDLGHSLSTRYGRFGDNADLEKSISMTMDAVRLTPDDHPRKPSRLSNLGSMFSIRYDNFGDAADLEKSISMFEDAARLTPVGHPMRALRLNNLAHVLSTRYARFGNDIDLERSTEMLEDVVRLVPSDHPDRPSWLNNLGASLLTRYERFQDAYGRQKSISMLEEAVRDTPDGHPDKPSFLNNLGRSLASRHHDERFKDNMDLEKSISLKEEAVRLTPDGHPDKPFFLHSLAFSFLERFQRNSAHDPSSSDLTQAILHSSRAARSSVGPSRHRFEASQVWINCSRLLQHGSQSESLLDAYMVAVHLLPQLAWIGLPLHDRHRQLLQAADMACDAAAAALGAGKPALAVEWLEQGRSIVWGQLSQLRTPVDELRDIRPELAAEFERVSRQLEQASVQGKRLAVDAFLDQSPTAGGSLERQAEQHHTLALLREKLLGDIRALPGFERFLLPKTISQLCPLAHLGPVVFLNASKYRCDALAVEAGSERVRHIPLSSTSYDEVAGMQMRLRKLLKLNDRTVSREDSERGARVQGMTPQEVFGSVLSSLWDKCMSPILTALGDSTSRQKRPRIFWCTTGPFSFLPIHAAGHYNATDSGCKLSDFVISSYIPTMNALDIPTQQDLAPRPIRLLAVRQPSTDGATRLRAVEKEMEVIQKLSSRSPCVDVQEADGTLDDVMEKMKDTHWVHFACHGMQDRAHPLDSGLLLAYGKRLQVADMVRLSRPRGGFAFLSACQTATGDERLTEEAIHIAGGMMLAGYTSVVATMWSIMDSDAPKVTEEVYRRLFLDGKAPDSREAAEALHHAVEQLRDSGVPFLSWVPFIHVGL